MVQPGFMGVGRSLSRKYSLVELLAAYPLMIGDGVCSMLALSVWARLSPERNQRDYRETMVQRADGRSIQSRRRACRIRQAGATHCEATALTGNGRELWMNSETLHLTETARIRRMAMAALMAFTLIGCSAGRHAERTERQARSNTARALFEKRCEKAGVKISRTVDNVEGVFLLKLRSSRINFDDQFVLDDPYGNDFGGDAYIRTTLRGALPPIKERTPLSPPDILGFLYVEAIDPVDGKRYRYTGSKRLIDHESGNFNFGNYVKSKILQFVVDRVPAPGPAPRYGVTDDDISTREDREHWIAGSSLRVVDLQTNEVIAERIVYMYDPGQGSQGGNRSPGLMAASFACPALPGRPAWQARQTVQFVQQVLKHTEKNGS